MYIDDISTGSEISILVKSQKGSVDLQTTAVFYAAERLYEAVRKISGCERVLFVAPIYVDGKLISFEGEGFVTNLSVNVDGRAHTWTGVKLKTLHLGDKTLQFAASDLPGKEENRRGSFRLDVGAPVTVQIGGNRTPVKAMIENVSESGAGITVEKSEIENIPIGGRIAISFNDGFLIQGFQKTAHFKLQGEIVRCVDLLNAFEIGCKFENANPMSADGYKMAQYINGKQRERMKKGRR